MSKPHLTKEVWLAGLRADGAAFRAAVGQVDALDPGLPAWNPAPQAKRVEYWYRRMAHETALHRWDAQMAVGLGEPIEAKLAADGVTEVLDTDTLLDDLPHHERVVAAATASDLLLSLWGRVRFDVLEVAGDTGLLEAL